MLTTMRLQASGANRQSVSAETADWPAPQVFEECHAMKGGRGCRSVDCLTDFSFPPYATYLLRRTPLAVKEEFARSLPAPYTAALS